MNHGKNGVLATIFAASCCVLPLLLITLGLGGSMLAVVLVRYKAYFMTIAVAALAYAWVQYRRDTKQCASRACTLVGGRLRKWMLGINTGIVALFFLLTYTPAGSLANVGLQDDTGRAQVIGARRHASNPSVKPSDTGSGEQARLEHLALRVEGMT